MYPLVDLEGGGCRYNRYSVQIHTRLVLIEAAATVLETVAHLTLKA